MKQIPTLDGWRGIAILMVLADHATIAALQRYPHPWMRIGLHGVTLFFVLSGFLITSNLLAGPIDLKKFYIRRFFRLMPTAWTFLAALLLLNLSGIHCTSWREIRGCLFFYRNFQGNLGTAGHFWSLSIEEQFYLVWPALLLLFGVRRCRWIALAGAASVAAYRFAFWRHYEQGLLYTRTEVRADALLLGCMFALLRNDPAIREKLNRWSELLAVPAAGAFLIAIATSYTLQPLWESAAVGALLIFTSLHPAALVSRLLEWKPLAWLGTLSYTIYIWQEPFTVFHGKWLFVAGGFIFPAFVLASHFLVERPMRKFGRRIAENQRRHRVLEAAPQTG